MLPLAAALLLSPVSTPVELASTPAPLHGTLLTPEGQTKAVAVILPGSGPTDRDGNSPPFGIRASTYRLLAEGLAEHGVASIPTSPFLTRSKAPRVVRFCFAKRDETLEKAAERLQKV